MERGVAPTSIKLAARDALGLTGKVQVGGPTKGEQIVGLLMLKAHISRGFLVSLN